MQEGLRVRVVRRTYGEHEQIMRGRRRRGRSASNLDGKIGRWPWLSGSRGLPIAVASDETT
jgi:hypothetical protein